MESKHLFMILGMSVFVTLLIEPVWNRNFGVEGLPGVANTLLIEPVWNRNQAITFLLKNYAPLLIEPVWNRNSVWRYLSGQQNLSFNRTSMESKHSSQ